MWCPKCKNEYIAGITMCSDCNIPLVEELTKENTMPYEDTSISLSDIFMDDMTQPEEEDNRQSSSKSKVYVKKDMKYEDVKSTAYTFITVGIIGILFLILIGLDVISLSMTSYMRTLMIIVMGTLFLIFLVIGVRYFRKLSSLKAEIQEEETASKDILDWFLTNHTASSIDSQIADKPSEEEQLYFARYEIMMQALQQQFSSLDESFADHMIEEIYEKIFITE